MNSTFAGRWNESLLTENYEKWQRDPHSVDASWSAFFEGFSLGLSRPAEENASNEKGEAITSGSGSSLFQSRIDGIIHAYRSLGHTIAEVDPLADQPRENPLLSLEELGFSEADLDRTVSSSYYEGGREMPLRELIASLKRTYCGVIGYEYNYIQDPTIRHWVRSRIEGEQHRSPLSGETYRMIMRILFEAEAFENFLHTKYVGSKRFSLEGGEALMVALEAILNHGKSHHDVREIVMGMAHRGRLNVLANFLHKPLCVIFSEFSDDYIPEHSMGSGDVKYHLGYETKRVFEDGKEVLLQLVANPSHLEAVDPVVEGKARARQRFLEDTKERRRVLPLLLHGDAAFAGQGIISEVLNMSQLEGYRTGGTLHIIINNQIGFTTLPADARSSHYCTDIAKLVEAPIFHVNGDHPEAVYHVAKIALDFRQEFSRDVVVDILCYRRHGHNEGDEPMFTQPNLYSKIKAHPTLPTIFAAEVLEKQLIPEEEVGLIKTTTLEELNSALDELKRQREKGKFSKFEGSTAVYQPEHSFDPVKTAISKEMLDKIVHALTTVPDGFNVLAKVRRIVLDRRAHAHQEGGPYNWAFAEALAFGSLLLEGTPVRLSGQDSRRGTFSQRHSVLYDEKTRERYIPLMHIDKDQARFCVYNSLLSEAAVLGFDYGYSMDFPSMLCMWEAQFGDFANGAQVIIDQFISSAESKWQRPSGIVLLLPHGYEGQGPEHSSARLERFLQLCAEDNLQVCNPTTPAQYFHVLRRQIHRNFRKPLIIMTPKSLLNFEKAVSHTEDFTKSQFSEILPDPSKPKPSTVERVILCSGKVYYDLEAYREAHKNKVAILRVEQLYPLHVESLKKLVGIYSKAKKFVWCQEEPQNMGAWTFISPRLEEVFGKRFSYAGRVASASPAAGSARVHKQEQAKLIETAFSI